MVRFWTTLLLVGFAEARYYRLFCVCDSVAAMETAAFHCFPAGLFSLGKAKEGYIHPSVHSNFSGGVAVFEGAEIDAAPLSTSVALADNPQRIGWGGEIKKTGQGREEARDGADVSGGEGWGSFVETFSGGASSGTRPASSVLRLRGTSRLWWFEFRESRGGG